MGRGWGGRGQYQVCDQGAVATITRSTSLVTTNSRNTGIVIPDLIQTIVSEADRPVSLSVTGVMLFYSSEAPWLITRRDHLAWLTPLPPH